MSTERDRNILNMIMNPLMPTGNVIEEPEEITEEGRYNNYLFNRTF